MALLPVTAHPPLCPGSWGSPYSRPRLIELRHHPRGYVLHKGIWMVRCGANRVELAIYECFEEEQRRPPGTGMLPHSPPPKPPLRPPRTNGMPAATPAARPQLRPYFEDDAHTPEARAQWQQSQCPPSPPPCPPISNHIQWIVLVREGQVGTVFADGWNMQIRGAGDALIIRVY